MAYVDTFHMPGAFHTEGVHPGLFRPPMSPAGSAASSGYLPARTPTYDTNTKRKRRNNEHRSREACEAELADAQRPFFSAQAIANFDGTFSRARQQPHTPTGEGHMGESMFSDGDFRQMLGTKRPRKDTIIASDPSDSVVTIHPPPEEVSVPSQGWANFAYSTIGGVFGKVWSFCTAGTFTGFQAGGGAGYGARYPDHTIGQYPASDFWAETKQQTPGQADETGYDSGASTLTGPTAKRRQTAPVSDLGNNWVIVGNSEDRRTTISARPSPRTRNSSAAVTTGRRISTPTVRRSTASRLSVHTQATAPPRPASSASFASPRLESEPVSQIPVATSYTAASTPTRPPMHRRQTSERQPMTPTHRRSNSTASSASARGGVSRRESAIESSPRLDAEAKKLASRRNRESREIDTRMNNFNRSIPGYDP